MDKTTLAPVEIRETGAGRSWGCSTTMTTRQPHVLLRSDSGTCEGLFVNVVIGIWTLAMLVDTGSDVTILQKQLDDKCFAHAHVNPDSVRSILITVTGESANFYGKVAVDFKKGNWDFTHDVYLADIKSDGILSLDFLSKYECNVLLGQGSMKIGKEKVPCYGNSDLPTPMCCRVCVSEDVEVPPESIMMINAKLYMYILIVLIVRVY